MKKVFVSLLAIVLALSAKSQDTIGIWQVIDFESNYEYLINDTSSQNLWQVGTPQKTFFDAAYSPQKAMVTDTLNYYPQGNHSWFDLYLGDFNFPGLFPYDIFIDFWHKYDTDTLKDGCYITVSYDNGSTWTNIVNDSIYVGNTPYGGYNSINLYNNYSDTLFNGEFGFSGNSGGWIHTSFEWYPYIVKTTFPPDTMILRFNFLSDGIGTNREGWMIDNIRLFSLALGGGFPSFNKENFIENIYPNPISDKFVLELSNDAGAFSVSISNPEGKQIFSANYPRNNSTIISVPEIAPGNYFITVVTDNGLSETKSIVVE